MRTRCDGVYEIAIVAEKLGEDDALELESELIARHGGYLTNWVNPGRKFDYAALERFMRSAMRRRVSYWRPGHWKRATRRPRLHATARRSSRCTNIAR